MADYRETLHLLSDPQISQRFIESTLHCSHHTITQSSERSICDRNFLTAG